MEGGCRSGQKRMDREEMVKGKDPKGGKRAEQDGKKS